MYSIVLQENDLQEWESNTSIREFADFEQKEEKKKGLFGAVAAPIVGQAGTQFLGGLVNKIFGARRRKIRLKRRRRKRWNLKCQVKTIFC